MYGARKADGSDIPTKSALKREILANPDNVYLYDTSLFSPEMDRKGSNLEVGRRYDVVGPNPYNSRKWYANVLRAQDGRILVK